MRYFYKILYIYTGLLFVAQLAPRKRSKLATFVGTFKVPTLPFKGNLVVYFTGRLLVAGTTRPPAAWHNVARIVSAAGRQALGRRPVALGRRLGTTRPPAAG